MKYAALVFSLLMLSGLISLAYAHSDFIGATVQNQDGTVLYQQETSGYEKKDPKTVELFSKDWFYYNIIWELCAVIILTTMISGLTVYREEITPRISKMLRHT